jgi:RimJ/RimL family protein N-acetyltransferase
VDAVDRARTDERIAWIRQTRNAAAAGGDAVSGVFLDETPIGGAGLHHRRGAGVLEIGYWIDVRHTQRGYATELVRALTMCAFDRPDVMEVAIYHDRANVPSGRVPARLGFRMASEQRRTVQAPGECGIDVGWRVDRADWLAAR